METDSEKALATNSGETQRTNDKDLRIAPSRESCGETGPNVKGSARVVAVFSLGEKWVFLHEKST